MADRQGFTYSADLVLVIDATGSMAPIIESVKASALSLHDDLAKYMDRIGKTIDWLRVRVIAFRDFYSDPGEESLVTSDFFRLPEQGGDLADFLHGIRACGGGDEPESGLEGLCEAIRSSWAGEGAEQRQIVVVWTDAGAHPLEKNRGAKPVGYPAHMAADLNELADLWDGSSSPVHPSGKRLLLYAPDMYPWTEISNNWQNALQYTSKAGAGLGDRDYRSILYAIAQSV
jgi:hypothetical protein